MMAGFLSGRGAFARIGGVAVIAATLSACSMGSMFGGGGNTAATADLATTNASQSEINLAAQSALPAIATECPPIKVRPGGEALFAYAGKTGDARTLNYQAVIDKQSRNCVVSNGLITVNMGVVGRVLLGPAGNQSDVTVPVRFAVERDGLAVFSQRYDLPVTIDASTQSADFVKVVDGVAIPYVGGEDITIWVGFDSRRS